ncbi:hypothetical protein BCR44DRAFT_308233 [Catenaria anguillulae PL171]|uniref:Uncharacterized protein n=1 Tax=Catenaria anguillulae PL171 TaxID=765915 RepID=A0A1Y2HUN6_9FUNG|nr:hypothetical protein BCR44DRAFT_308233 [Catenaria anguillulae PL171]
MSAASLLQFSFSSQRVNNLLFFFAFLSWFLSHLVVSLHHSPFLSFALSLSLASPSDLLFCFSHSSCSTHQISRFAFCRFRPPLIFFVCQMQQVHMCHVG